jgi:uncharacterized membrane protein YbaN (DUF454 family)
VEAKVLETPLNGRVERAPGDVVPACLDIAIDDRSGSIQVRDPRSFHAGRRAFCRRLIEAAVRQPGILKAEIELGTATCRIQFDPGSSTARAMAEALSVAIGQATAKARASRTLPWWRREREWSRLTAYPIGGDVSLWETLESESGRLTVRHSGAPNDRGQLARLRDSVVGLVGVDSCQTCTWSPTLVVQYAPESPIAPRLLDALECGLRVGDTAGSPLLVRKTQADVPHATGLKRLLYLTIGGGCLALTGVALLIPGMPTVPFLLATSYFLARSSAALDARLRRMSFLGPILEDWEFHRGLSLTSKRKLVGLKATIVLITVAIVPLTTSVLLLIVLIGCVSIVGILRLPGVEPDATGKSALNHSGRLALAGP